MSTKTIILSSSGLKNLIRKSFDDEVFCFIFGEKEIIVNNIFAEFISPSVSQLHISDPTISSIKFDNFFNIDITEDIILLFKQVSSGFSIELNEEQSYKMKILSIYINNEELYGKIEEHYPSSMTKDNINQNLQILPNFHSISFSSMKSKIIENISSNFCSIDQNKLLRLPKSVLYSILSNDHLKIQNEDSLFDFIKEIFLNDAEYSDELNIASFYELIEFANLSEKKFSEFLNDFDFNILTKNLWSKLLKCFYINYSSHKQEKNDKNDSADSFFPFDGNSSHSFKGIIHHLTEKNGGNVDSKGIVKLSSSSICSDVYTPKNVVDFSDMKSYFLTNNGQSEWLRFDFVGLKVRPTHYSIRSRPDGGYHPKNWVIEGSNTGMDDDWKILDTKSDVNSFNGDLAVQTFEIEPKLKENECYGFLRMRLTGPNTRGHCYFSITTFEFFGYLY
ncbi:hypothetical protein M9Y10_021444 [Tritrichomonas musculus]|uniref:F5/8 type C domain-containing protein n=1 Tax=Tritrichomonas musculus TaxID=1915356 RepID=A0ABR2HEW0_9EUKA